MSKEVKINGLTLVPIKDALDVVSYSKDYIARLAREGKIVGSQIGRQWFVDVVSLKNFSAEAVVLEDVRKQELSAERKRELIAKECLSLLDEVVVKKARAQRFDAIVVTCSTVCIGLLVGVGLYTATLIPETKLAGLASSLGLSTDSAVEVAAVVSPDASPFRVIDKPKDTLLLTTITERPVFETESEMRKLASLGEGILLLPTGSERMKTGDVANLFSDEVTVTYSEDNQGVISYDKSNGEVINYPFVAVPRVNDKEGVFKIMNE